MSGSVHQVPPQASDAEFDSSVRELLHKDCNTGGIRRLEPFFPYVPTIVVVIRSWLQLLSTEQFPVKQEIKAMITNDARYEANEGVPEFPYAPEGWQLMDARALAEQMHIVLGNDHLELLGALQEYFAKHDKQQVKIRELHDALDERFHARGGMKYLYHLLAGGPIAQGCSLAGLPAPAGSVDMSFGSVL